MQNNASYCCRQLPLLSRHYRKFNSGTFEYSLALVMHYPEKEILFYEALMKIPVPFIMQRSLSIAFIALLAASQYARQLSYLQCRLINNFTTATHHCDCEKQSAEVQPQPNGKEFPVTKVSIPADTAEFYTPVKTNALFDQWSLLLPPSFLQHTAAVCKGSCGRLYKPPRC